MTIQCGKLFVCPFNYEEVTVILACLCQYICHIYTIFYAITCVRGALLLVQCNLTYMATVKATKTNFDYLLTKNIY